MPVPDPAPRAVRMALAMQREVGALARGWRKRGYELAHGRRHRAGLRDASARIGFEGRIDYGAIGTVTNLAARLCGEAQGGQILVSQRVMAALDGAFAAEPVGELALKGFHRPVPAFRLRAG